MDMSQFNIDYNSLPVGEEIDETKYENQKEIDFLEGLLKRYNANASEKELEYYCRKNGYESLGQCKIILNIKDKLAEAENELKEYVDFADRRNISKFQRHKKQLEDAVNKLKAELSLASNNSSYRVLMAKYDKGVLPKTSETARSVYNSEEGVTDYFTKVILGIKD